MLIVASAASQWVSYSRIDIIDYYVAMGYSDKMLEMIQNAGWDQGAAFGWMGVYYAVPMLVYLILIKRFFNGKGDEYV